MNTLTLFSPQVAALALNVVAVGGAILLVGMGVRPFLRRLHPVAQALAWGGQPVALLPGLTPGGPLAASPDGPWVAAADGATAVVWQHPDIQPCLTLTHPGLVGSLAFDPAGELLAVGLASALRPKFTCGTSTQETERSWEKPRVRWWRLHSASTGSSSPRGTPQERCGSGMFTRGRKR